MSNWLEQYMAIKPKKLDDLAAFLKKMFPAEGAGSIELDEKGGPGSGHYGHAGRPGQVGGSVSGSVAMSIRTGRTASARQAAASAQGRAQVQRGKTPVGTPVSDHLNLDKAGGPNSRVGKAVRHALGAINKVHGDGTMSEVPVIKSYGERRQGEYFYYQKSGEPIHIKLSHKGDRPELSALHEIGHYLDHQGLDKGSFASEKAPLLPEGSGLRRWFDAAKESRAMLRVKEIYDTGRINYRYVSPDAKPGEYTLMTDHADMNYARYLQHRREVFARSYAQYVTIRSGDPVLLGQLNQELAEDAGQVGYPEFWSHEDFQPIAAAFDQIFEEQGWRQ